MRRATAADEILPLKDPRVQKNEAYLIVILLSRVVTRLGSVAAINPKVIEGLFATDLAFLQDLYNRINALETATACPQCGKPTGERTECRDGGARPGSRRLPPRSTDRRDGVHRLPLPLGARTTS